MNNTRVLASMEKKIAAMAEAEAKLEAWMAEYDRQNRADPEGGTTRESASAKA